MKPSGASSMVYCAGWSIALLIFAFASHATSTPAYLTYFKGTGGVPVIDTATNSTVGGLPCCGEDTNGIAVTPDGTRVYVSNGYYDPSHVYANTVSVIDTATNLVVATIPFVGGAMVTFTRNGTVAYVTN